MFSDHPSGRRFNFLKGKIRENQKEKVESRKEPDRQSKKERFSITITVHLGPIRVRYYDPKSQIVEMGMMN